MKRWSGFISLILVIVICFILACDSVGATNINFISNASKIDSYLNEKLETASQDELISVHIWYKDINHNSVEQLVENECGFSKEEIAIEYEMPSVELITSYKNGDVSAKTEMSNYMHRTENLRTKEKQRTDEYVITRRNVSKSKYNEKSFDIISSLNIPEDKIIFRSEYAPTLIAELNKDEIERLNNDRRIESIEYYFPFESVEDESTDSVIALEKDILNIVKVNDTLGLTGVGVKIGMIESTHPDVSHDSIDGANIINRGDIREYEHSINVARIMVGDSDGIAKNATLYSVCNSNNNYKEKTFDYTQFEWLLSQGVSVINISYGLETSAGVEYSYTFPEKWIDHLVAYHNVTVVKAAGNDGKDNKRVSVPGLAHNIITVGSFSTKLSPETTDDYLLEKSSWTNSGVYGGYEYEAIEKPDIIMPGEISTTDHIGKSIVEIIKIKMNGGKSISSGTSFAAPFLTGSIALMLELKPSLAAFPQAIKAIVLASCHRKVGRSPRNEAVETLEEGITECQGAGVPDVWTMACIISQGTYGVGVLDDQQNIHRFYQPNYSATKMNVSLCWLRENNEDGSEDNNISVGPNINLDLYVNNNGTQHTSLNGNSSTEMTYFDLDAINHMYEMEVRRISSYSDSVRYGYAYSTNESYFGTARNDGIYKVKNLLTQEYLTLNPTNNELVMQEYSNLDSKQDWIIKYNSVGGWNIISGNASTQGAVAFGDSYDTNSKKIELSNEAVGFSLFSWEGMSLNQDYGAFRFYTRTGSDAWYIGCDDNNAILSSNISSLFSSYWALEKQNYRLGDANADGVINELDKTLVQSYLANSVTLDNKQMFLADVDRDGTVSIIDAYYIEIIYL